MYVRFVCNRDHPTVDAEIGMFAARKDTDFSHMKGSWHRAHDEAFYWFSPRSAYGGLHYPKINGKLRTRSIRQSLFWFREDATVGYPSKVRLVEKVEELARLMIEAGLESRVIRHEQPGRVIWKDTKQALIFPEGVTVPRAFTKKSA